jgi:hypothetical protein
VSLSLSLLLPEKLPWDDPELFSVLAAIPSAFF